MAKTLLPAQDSNTNGKLLKSNGTDASWEEADLTAIDIDYTDTNSNLGDAADVQAALDNAGGQLASHVAENAIDAHATTPYVEVSHSTSQSIPSATWTTLAFNTEYKDTDTIHDIVNNNSRLTCNKAGLYLVVGAASFTVITSGFESLRILKNGVTPMGSSALNGVTNGATDIQYTNLIYLEVGDYIELQAYHNKSTASSIVSAPPGTPKFMMVKVG